MPGRQPGRLPRVALLAQSRALVAARLQGEDVETAAAKHLRVRRGWWGWMSWWRKRTCWREDCLGGPRGFMREREREVKHAAIGAVSHLG